MNSKDSILLEKLQNGDDSAFKELFDLYFVPLSIYSLKYCDSFQMAEDITQDIFVKFWDEKIYLKLNDSIGPYLFKSIKNNTLQAIKSQKKYSFEIIEEQVDHMLEFDTIDFDYLEKEKQKLMIQVESLPEKSKVVFKAIVLENLKYKEVAEQLDISVNTVKTHYSRALKKLRTSTNVIIMLLLV